MYIVDLVSCQSLFQNENTCPSVCMYVVPICRQSMEAGRRDNTVTEKCTYA